MWLDCAVNATDTPIVLGDGTPLPPHDDFYRELTTRNTPLVTPEEQERLRTATILIAGAARSAARRSSRWSGSAART